MKRCMQIHSAFLSAGAIIGSLTLSGLTLNGPLSHAVLAADAPATSTPTVKPDKADPAAFALLKAAHDNRQVLPANFAGLTAEVVFDDNGKQSTGTVTYKPDGKSEVQVAGLEQDAKAWLDDQVLSMMGHRRGGDFAKGDGRHPLTFGKDDKNPWGRLVQLNDTLQSSYRVRNNEVVEVTRIMGNLSFTISVLETMKTEAGKYLSKHFVVSYRDAKTGALQEVQGFRDAYDKIEGTRYGTLWLPSRRMVIFFETGQPTARTRVITLRNFKML